MEKDNLKLNGKILKGVYINHNFDSGCLKSQKTLNKEREEQLKRDLRLLDTKKNKPGWNRVLLYADDKNTTLLQEEDFFRHYIDRRYSVGTYDSLSKQYIKNVLNSK